MGYVPVSLLAAADSVAISAHKIHGSKGCGALLLREGLVLRPIWAGGGQEGGLRTGTQNVPGIAGLRAAVHEAVLRQPEAAVRMAELRDGLVAQVTQQVPGSRLIGSRQHRSPANASIAFPGLKAEPMLHALEARDVFVSSGSACHSREGQISHVLTAVGLDASVGVLRISLCRDTTAEETRLAADALVEVARSLVR